jgi:hypothetical protein
MGIYKEGDLIIEILNMGTGVWFASMMYASDTGCSTGSSSGPFGQLSFVYAKQTRLAQ